MKRIAITIFALSLLAVAQSASPVVGIGGQTATSFATSLSQCPTMTTPGTYFICVVVPGGTTAPFLALSVAGYNGGAPFVASTPTTTPNFTASATTLPAGSSATATYNNATATFLFGIPTGATGPAGPTQSFVSLNCPTASHTNSGLTASGCTEQ